MLFIVATMTAFFNLKTYALDLTYSGSSSSNNTGATATTSGYTITYDAAKDNICGYRFSVVSSAGTPKSGTKVANVYLSNLDIGTTAYSSGQRFIVSSGVVANKKQLANGTKVKSSTATQSCDYKSGSCGFYSTLAQNPSSMSSWIKNSSSNYLNLQRIYVICGTNLSNATESDYVIIEPLFWVKLAGTRTAATATELAIYGAAVSGGDGYKGTNGNLYNAGSGTLWNLSNYINREFPNTLYVSSKTDVYAAVTINSSEKYIYKDIISKGYGCSVLTVKNVITIKKVKIAYHPNGGTTNTSLNDYGWIMMDGATYFHTIKHGNSGNPYNASTFGMKRTGYKFGGWEVYSTGKILDENTDYASTVYAQYDDSSKTTANTETVYCYLYAKWIPHTVKVAFHPNGGTTSLSLNANGFIIYDGTVYPQTIKHGTPKDPYNASTLSLTRTGYKFAGWKVSSSGKILDENTEYSSTHYADYTDSSKTTSNTETVYCHLYAQWTANTVKLSYNVNGGSISSSTYKANSNGHISDGSTLYFDTLKYGESDDPYNASTFGLTRTGYQFAGWKVRSTGKILDENTDYGSTTYAQYDDKSKNTSNTATVYCYLDAVWTPNVVKMAYNPNGGTTNTSLNTYGWIMMDGATYFHSINYGNSDDPYNASTFGLTRTGYKFAGWKVSSTGTILDENTDYASTVYADESDKNKTTKNTATVYCYLYAVWEKNTYTNTITHWKYVGTGGDNNNGTYKKMGTSNLTGTYSNSVTIPTNLVQTYTGYYNTGVAGSYWGSSTWTSKNIGTTFTQPAKAVNIEYYYQPKKVTVVFNKNNGTSDTASQNFTYAVAGNKFGYNNNGTPKWHNNVGQFGNWDRTGYTLLGWSENASATSADYPVYSNVSDSWINTKVPNPNSTATVNLYAVWSKNSYTSSISHWAWGFNGNGNNTSGNAYKLDSVSTTKKYGAKYTLTESNAIEIPNGFYLNDKYATDAVTGSWTSYSYGTEITQQAKWMGFEFDYYPINYNITYELNGGTNNSNNPSTYNVLYEKSFSYPSKVGHEFLGWTRKVEKDKVTMAPSTSSYRHTRILNDIEPGTEYRITIGSALATSGSATMFSCYIYDFTDSKSLAFQNLHLGYNKEITIRCPATADTSHDICILFYSGLAGYTNDVGTEFTNIEINYDLDVINKSCNSVFSSADEIYTELAKRTTGDITLIANWEETNRITIVPVDPNAPYRENTDIISGFWLVNLNNTDYTDSRNAKVSYSVYNQDGQKITEDIKSFICPRNDKNLSFFSWYIPEGYGNKTLIVKAHIVEGSETYGHIEQSFEIEPYAICKTPDTSYTDKKPTDFTVPSVSSEENLNARWWQWEYTGGTFVKKEYAVGCSVDNILLSAPNSPTAYIEDNNLYLKSGYGFECCFYEHLTNVDGYESSSIYHATGNQYQYALFPEFNYEYGIDTSRYIEIDPESGKNTFVFDDSMERQHFTPIYYPDGEYKFKLVMSDCWTPAGMLKTTEIVTIYINGNMYDDWNIQHK